jgi:hypothetical protein
MVHCNENKKKREVGCGRHWCEFFFQEEQSNCPISISTGQEFIWDNVVIQPHDYEAVNQDDLSYRIIQDVEQLEEEEEVQEQDVEEPEEDSSEEDC